MDDLIAFKKDAQTVGLIQFDDLPRQAGHEPVYCRRGGRKVQQNLATGVRREILQTVAGGITRRQALRQSRHLASIFPGQ